MAEFTGRLEFFHEAKVLNRRIYHVAIVFCALVCVMICPPLRAQSPGVDGFNVFPVSATAIVYALAVQPDGRIILGGNFTNIGGLTCGSIARVNPDGSLDTTFGSGANGLVETILVQSDGKILVSGNFDIFAGEVRRRIARLDPDGTLDTAFNPEADRPVLCMALQADGKILVGGAVTMLGGQPCNYIGRLNSDGTLDSSFNPGADAPVRSIALQPDGKILVGGAFSNLGGQARRCIGRLNPDGSLDTGFTLGSLVSGSGGYTYVSCLVGQPDGKILVGGDFSLQARRSLVRLNSNGSLDTNFVGRTDYIVNSMDLQADGKVLVGGVFENLGGLPCRNFGRLNPDGSLEVGFNLNARGPSVNSLALQSDGKILVGGFLGPLGGQPRNTIGRVNASAPATQSLVYDGSTINWLRGGTGAEVWRVTFDWSMDGLVWNSLGNGIRIAGGWRRTGAFVPAQATIRARGYAAGGGNSGSSCRVEDYVGPLVWVTQPTSRTNDAGSTAVFGGVVGGTPPLNFQWFHDGVPMTNGGRVSGATSAWLVVSNSLGGDAGAYQLVVSNSYGARTSVVATLTVNEPVIAVHPVSQNREPGGSVTLSMSAYGTTLGYQWWKDGEAISGHTQSTLSMTNLSPTDAGVYWAVVTSPYGSATSRVAWLTVDGTTADAAFNPEVNGVVLSFADQVDGKFLIGGDFTVIGRQLRQCIARFHPSGGLDFGFNPSANSTVRTIAVQADGKIVVGGSFSELGGQPRSRIGRLHADGTLDAGFNPGANSDVRWLVLQPDGKILVGGSFTNLGGMMRNYIGRLNADGTVDSTFDPDANSFVRSLALQPDRKIVVGGYFTTLAGEERNGIARLNADGTLDRDFNPGTYGYSTRGDVYALVLQADGKIVLGGNFATLGGESRDNLGRLNPDGSLDTMLKLGANRAVSSLAVQSDGKILVGGSFTNLAGQTRFRIGRLNPDGSPDLQFNPEVQGGVFPSVDSVAVQTEGQVLVSGSFATLGGVVRNRFGRLDATDPAEHFLLYDGSAIQWQRGGSTPEVSWTTSEWSSDGVAWTSLGEGIRVQGGWRWTSSNLPPFTTIRARGFIAGGGNSSSWFVEDRLWYPGALPLTVERGIVGHSNLLAFGTTTIKTQAVIVEASSNFVHWVPVFTNLPANGAFRFTDPITPSNLFRFYRAYQLP